MKKIILTSIILLNISSNAFAWGSQCGFEPFKPLTCMNGYYICQCNMQGQCQWLLQGC